MKRTYFACSSLLVTVSFFLLGPSNPAPSINKSEILASPISAHAGPQPQAKILNNYAKLPLSFEANRGQTDARVKFLSRVRGYTLFLTQDEAVLTLDEKADTREAKAEGAGYARSSSVPELKSGGTLRMKLRKANPTANVTGLEKLAGTSNYFIGNDPTRWRTNVPNYNKVQYKEVYSGIDLVYHGNQRQLEYDFIVAPGADPRLIAFDVQGAEEILRDGRGDLVFKIGEREIRWHKPVVYQREKEDSAPREIAADYAITGKNGVSFELAKYDATKPLYIDPVIYSTYLGGSNTDSGTGIAVDGSGNVYITGSTFSTDFPATTGVFQTTCNGGSNCSQYGDAFVSKMNATGTALVYSTYLGGSAADAGAGIAVDSTGDAYITGQTTSTDFPTTPSAFQTTNTGRDAFVTEIDPSGSALVYSTYLGGSVSGGAGFGIAVDSASDAYVTGLTFALDHSSSDFPVTAGAFQTVCENESCDFVTKFNPTGTALIYSTLLGEANVGGGIAVDSSGNAYITGNTLAGIPTTPGAFQTTCSGPMDAFVTKFNTTGTALVYSTCLSSSQSSGSAIAVDNAGDAYVTGGTYAGFPTTPGAFQTTCNDLSVPECSAAFVTEINPAGSALVYSTLLGGSATDRGSSIAVDSSGNAFVTGQASSTTFPTTPGAFQTTLKGVSDAFVTEINPSGSALYYSTYLGGSAGDQGLAIAVDNSHNAYITGQTFSTDFPTTTGAFQTTCNGGGNCSQYGDAFVTKINFDSTGQDFSMTNSGSSTATVSPGQTANYTLALASAGGSSQTVALTCSGAPAQSTCSVPSSVTLNSPTATMVTVSVTTAGTSANLIHPANLPPAGRPVMWLALCGLPGLTILCTVSTGRRNWCRRLFYGMAFLCLVSLGIIGSSCGGNANGSNSGGTPAGSYNLTVTGTFISGSTTLTHSMKLTLVVQ